MIFDAMCQHKRLDKTVLHIVTEVRMETQTRHKKAFETPVVVTPGLHSILVSIDQGPGRRSKTVPGLFFITEKYVAGSRSAYKSTRGEYLPGARLYTMAGVWLKDRRNHAVVKNETRTRQQDRHTTLTGLIQDKAWRLLKSRINVTCVL